jgi:hypothetical protein
MFLLERFENCELAAIRDPWMAAVVPFGKIPDSGNHRNTQRVKSG